MRGGTLLQAFSDFLYIEWLAELVNELSWFWPICEIIHFIGLALLVGVVGLYDLRLLGFAKTVPLEPLRRLLPWGVAGFVLCVVTGAIFVSGNAFKEPLVLLLNLPFQLKMIFMALAGLNVAAFYRTSLHERVTALGPDQAAPRAAKFIAASSLLLWIGVIYMGRMIPWEDAILYALGK